MIFLFAYDVARGAPRDDPMDYFARATAAVRDNRQRYAEAEARARARRPERAAFCDVPFGGAGGMVVMGEGGEGSVVHTFGGVVEGE